MGDVPHDSVEQMLARASASRTRARRRRSMQSDAHESGRTATGRERFRDELRDAKNVRTPADSYGIVVCVLCHLIGEIPGVPNQNIATSEPR